MNGNIVFSAILVFANIIFVVNLVFANIILYLCTHKNT